GSFTNDGTIVVDGGTLNLISNGTWTGEIRGQNGTLNFFGSFRFDPSLTLRNSGGIISIGGTLDNTGQTLTLDDSLGIVFVDGGTIRGGTVLTTGNNDLEMFHNGTLDGVTLNGTLNSAFSAATARVINGLTLNNGVIKIGAGGSLTFSGTQSLGGNGTV